MYRPVIAAEDVDVFGFESARLGDGWGDGVNVIGYETLRQCDKRLYRVTPAFAVEAPGCQLHLDFERRSVFVCAHIDSAAKYTGVAVKVCLIWFRDMIRVAGVNAV